VLVACPAFGQSVCTDLGCRARQCGLFVRSTMLTHEPYPTSMADPVSERRGKNYRGGGGQRADLDCVCRHCAAAHAPRRAHRRCGPACWARAPACGDAQAPTARRAALRALLLACVFARGADGGGARAHSGGGATLLLSASLAALQPRAALGATPLFSTYFPRESCCMKPNFLNENTAPELGRCRQVRVYRARRCLPMRTRAARCPARGEVQAHSRGGGAPACIMCALQKASTA